MGDGGCNGHLPRVTKARYETVNHISRGAVTFHEGDLANPTFALDDTVFDGQISSQRLRRCLVFNNADHLGGDFVFATWRFDFKVSRAEHLAHMHGLTRTIGPIKMRTIDGDFAVNCDSLPACDNMLNRQRFQIRGQDHIRTPTGCNRAKLAL